MYDISHILPLEGFVVIGLFLMGCVASYGAGKDNK